MLYATNFNVFYEKNRKEIDKYLLAAAWNYRHIVETDDMFQEIVLKLMKSSFLQDWDKEKGAALKTFFTGRIRGYALHVVTQKLKEYCVKKTKDEDVKLPVFIRLDRDYDFSGTVNDYESSGNYSVDLPEEATEEEETFYNEVLSLFKKEVSPLQAEIYILHWKGYDYREIERKINDKYEDDEPISYNTIRNKCIQATEIMLKILTSEGGFGER